MLRQKGDVVYRIPRALWRHTRGDDRMNYQQLSCITSSTFCHFESFVNFLESDNFGQIVGDEFSSIRRPFVIPSAAKNPGSLKDSQALSAVKNRDSVISRTRLE